MSSALSSSFLTVRNIAAFEAKDVLGDRVAQLSLAAGSRHENRCEASAAPLNQQ